MAFELRRRAHEEFLVIHHWDSDGIASAAILASVIRGTFVTPSKAKYEVTENIRELGTFKNVIVLDMELDPEELTEVGKEIFVIDHHEVKSELKRAARVYLNSRTLGGEWPTAYLTKKVADRILKSKKNEWLSKIGVVGDHMYDQCKSLFQGDDPSRYVRISSLVNAGYRHSWEQGAKLALEALIKANPEDWQELEEFKILEQMRREVSEEVKRKLEDYVENAERYSDIPILFYRNESPYYILPLIASLIHARNRNWIVVVYEEGRAEIRAENVNLLQVIKRLKSARGSGHPEAVGVSFEDFEEFKEELLRVLSGPAGI